MLVKIIKSNAKKFLKILISVRSACIKKNPSRMRTEKKKSVYMYMYIFNVPGICEENDDETDYCNLVQDLYFPHSILFVGYGS